MNVPFLRNTINRRILLFVLYTIGLVASLFLAYALRFDFVIEGRSMLQFKFVVLWFVPLKLIFLILFRQFQGLLSYFSLPDLGRLFYSLAVPSAFTLFLWFYSGGKDAPPRGVILADFVLSFMGLAVTRLAFRVVREKFLSATNSESKSAKRVGIIGAGDVGATLAKELITKRGLGLTPVLFMDDDKNKWGSTLHGIPVTGSAEKVLKRVKELDLDEVIIAMPSAPAKRIGEIVRLLRDTGVKFETVPSMDQLATGTVKVSQLRRIEIQDLLGRDPVQLETEHIREIISGKVVMVTGAGGSIGSELCRQIASFNPFRLLLVEQCEVQLFQIEQELISLGYAGIIHPLVADIYDLPRLRQIFERFSPKVIFHAAAHKHVPMMESQPGEAIKNNSIATAQLAESALEFNVDQFVLISTDKAIHPTNIMGASKRLAEIFLQSLAAQNPGRTKFMAVRFGNVLGSSGSVIPIFNKQIAAGGPVRVTHPEVTRYFMTIPEAVGLVLQSATQGSGGEIFVLDMGNPVKIVDLARQLIELSGLRPGDDIEIEFTGLRPGEKLYEELSYKAENCEPTSHPKIMRFISTPEPFDRVQKFLHNIAVHLDCLEPNQIKKAVKEAVPDYTPYITE